ncbi:molybdopterin-dependent oxidoreductase [Streptomyces mirabilis]|uniref:molybdopterin-dependent oxidoreductase n=1 Tax=Streptomyces mirabilis TaxID=68239 RepID=UPI0036CCAF0D
MEWPAGGRRPRVVRDRHHAGPGPGTALPGRHACRGLGGVRLRRQRVSARFHGSRDPPAPPRNGELLTAEHGLPLRLVVPHLYGYESPKWLRGDRRRPAPCPPS